jgi:hypothetical protein
MFINVETIRSTAIAKSEMTSSIVIPVKSSIHLTSGMKTLKPTSISPMTMALNATNAIAETMYFAIVKPSQIASARAKTFMPSISQSTADFVLFPVELPFIWNSSR